MTAGRGSTKEKIERAAVHVCERGSHLCSSAQARDTRMMSALPSTASDRLSTSAAAGANLRMSRSHCGTRCGGATNTVPLKLSGALSGGGAVCCRANRMAITVLPIPTSRFMQPKG